MSEVEFKVAVQNAEGEEVESVSFPGDRLDTRVRTALLKEAIVMYQANKRQGTHETKTRSRIRGSNRKSWRQKGTGRARAGTRKSPLWRGGGVIFGPHPRDYSYSMNRKQRRRALQSALFGKFRSGEVKVIDRLEVSEPKTKQMAQLLKNLEIEGRVLIGAERVDRNVLLAARNIARLKLVPVAEFNAFDVLHARTVLLTKDAFSRLIGQDSDAAPPAGGPRGPEGGADAEV